MLTKNILIGMMATLVSISFLAGASIAGDNDMPSISLSDIESSNTMGNDGIEFDYSPMAVSSSLASVSPRNTDNEVIQFDYSPREDSRIIATQPLRNADGEDIQFDYSPRAVNCGTPYC